MPPGRLRSLDNSSSTESPVHSWVGQLLALCTSRITRAFSVPRQAALGITLRGPQRPTLTRATTPSRPFYKNEWGMDWKLKWLTHIPSALAIPPDISEAAAGEAT